MEMPVRVQLGGLVLCPHDEDWYVVEVEEGDGLEVDTLFNHSDGNLDLRLYRPNAEGILEPLDTGRTFTDNETVSLRVNAGESRVYYVHVYRLIPSDDPTNYSMTVNIFNRCADDVTGPQGEHNDHRGELAQLPDPGQRRQICDYDEDWYRISVVERARVGLHLLFDHSAGDLDMVLYNTEGARVGAGSPS